MIATHRTAIFAVAALALSGIGLTSQVQPAHATEKCQITSAKLPAKYVMTNRTEAPMTIKQKNCDHGQIAINLNGYNGWVAYSFDGDSHGFVSTVDDDPGTFKATSADFFADSGQDQKVSIKNVTGTMVAKRKSSVTVTNHATHDGTLTTTVKTRRFDHSSDDGGPNYGWVNWNPTLRLQKYDGDGWKTVKTAKAGNHSAQFTVKKSEAKYYRIQSKETKKAWASSTRLLTEPQPMSAQS